MCLFTSLNKLLSQPAGQPAQMAIISKSEFCTLSQQEPQGGLTLKVSEKLQLYGLYVYYVVHICDFGMLRVHAHSELTEFTINANSLWYNRDM